MDLCWAIAYHQCESVETATSTHRLPVLSSVLRLVGNIFSTRELDCYYPYYHC